jgi:cytochrome c556
MQRSALSAFLLLLTALSAVNPASAETKVADTIKYRQAVMDSLAAHVEALSMMAFNKVEKTEFYQDHADALANGTAELKLLFPAGSGQGDTHALPAIWENADDFSAATAKAEDAFASLRDAVAGGDNKAVMTAFAAAGKACKGCHEKYREEHDD